MDRRPNILFAFADDWGRYASIYRSFQAENSLNNLIDTPNFDRIATEGALFLNAYVPAPSCTPCRSSILSGSYFWVTGLGAILRGAVWDEEIPTYPLILEENGYHIGYTYKVWSPGKAINAPYGGERTRYEAFGSDFNQFSHVVTEMSKNMGIDEAKKILFDETVENFKSFLSDRPNGNPFCYWWGPTNTHRTWERGSGKHLWGIDPDSLTGRLPEFLPDVHEIREDVADYLGECLAFDAGLGKIIETLEESGELDNTLIVISGDHGIPGIPRAKCNLYDIGTEVALAVRWPEKIRPGRVVDDFVNLMDLAPTFLEVADVQPPTSMSAKSLMNVLTSNQSVGQIDSDRDWVVTGRERHVENARSGGLPYPMRAIRTKDFLYIRNFKPDRWPMGDPKGLDDLTVDAPKWEEISTDTRCAYGDLDASPTKAWMIHNRADRHVTDSFELAFGKRSLEELYDVQNDPDLMINLAEDSAFNDIRVELASKLDEILIKNNDPRLCETNCRFEFAPFAVPLSDHYISLRDSTNYFGA